MGHRRVASLAVFAVLFFAASAAHAYGESDASGFPSWSERVLLEWTNRARCDPQADLGGCTSCGDKACYSPVAPYTYSANLNRSSRFHSAENIKQGYMCLDHDSHCTVVANIASIYPGTCDGSASCACTGGADTCTASTCPCTAGTTPSARVGKFGTAMMFEGISSYDTPNEAFYQWLNESYTGTSCEYDGNHAGTTNGHRFQLIKGENGGVSATAAGFGVVDNSVSVVDEGIEATTSKLPSGAHYPRQAASVDVWANWYDAAGPQSALVNVDGECTALHLARGAVTNGAYTASVSGVGSGCHRYFFVFKDSGGALVTFPETGSLGIGPDGTCADFDATRPTTGASCNCTPQCSGKQCGDDGCGGSCGNCAGGTSCNASGQCVGGGGTGGDGGPLRGDGGTAAGGDGGAAGGGGDGSGTNNGDSSTDGSSGCGCTTTGRSSGNDALLAIGALSLGAALVRRRRARSRA